MIDQPNISKLIFSSAVFFLGKISKLQPSCFFHITLLHGPRQRGPKKNYPLQLWGCPKQFSAPSRRNIELQPGWLGKKKISKHCKRTPTYPWSIPLASPNDSGISNHKLWNWGILEWVLFQGNIGKFVETSATVVEGNFFSKWIYMKPKGFGVNISKKIPLSFHHLLLEICACKLL